MTDPYAPAADHLELFLSDAWTMLREPLREALAPVADRPGTVLEIGAGTGSGTEVVAAAVPAARLHVIEPSDSLRSALMHRVATDTDLRERTTVEHRPFPDAPLPDAFDALVMINTLGHLAPADRAQLWATVAHNLTTGGVAVVNLQEPSSATPIAEFPMGPVRVGDRVYHGTAWAEPTAAAEIRWHMTYLISVDGDEVDRRETTYTWHVVDAPGLRSELAAHGLVAEQVGDPATAMFRVVRA